MSANLDLVRSIYAKWERGDFRCTDWADEEIDFVNPEGPEPASWKGVRAMVAAWADFLTAWRDYHVVAEEYCELDAERILVLHRTHGEGRTSGVAFGGTDQMQASMFWLRDGKVTRLVLYWNRDGVLADLGLTTEGETQ